MIRSRGLWEMTLMRVSMLIRCDESTSNLAGGGAGAFG